MDYDHEQQHSPSFRRRIKSSICASCCFTYHIEPASSSSSSGSDDEGFHRKRLVSRSSSTSWIRSKTRDLPEEIKEKCTSLFSKIGGRGIRRPSNTSEYRYDPMSYSLNFDDEAAWIDEYPMRSFASRLPLSPPPARRFPVAVSREIVAWT